MEAICLGLQRENEPSGRILFSSSTSGIFNVVGVVGVVLGLQRDLRGRVKLKHDHQLARRTQCAMFAPATGRCPKLQQLSVTSSRLANGVIHALLVPNGPPTATAKTTKVVACVHSCCRGPVPRVDDDIIDRLLDPLTMQTQLASTLEVDLRTCHAATRSKQATKILSLFCTFLSLRF